MRKLNVYSKAPGYKSGPRIYKVSTFWTPDNLDFSDFFDTKVSRDQFSGCSI